MEKTRFIGLDGLRGVCALSVVLLHSELLFNTGAAFSHGYLSVDVFFLLSGFVISASYDTRLADGMTAWCFLKARIKRLAPVYWAGTTICIVAALARSHYQHAVAPGHVLMYGAMAAVLLPVLRPGIFAYPGNPVAWSLTWELVVNFLYARWLRRLSNGAMSAIIIILLALATAQAFNNSRGWSFGVTGSDVWLGGLRAVPEFLMGVVLYRLHCAGALQRLPRMTPLWPLTVWLAITAMPQGLPLVFDLGVVTVAAPLLVAILARNDAPRWLAPLGAVSYPLYASHLALVWLAQSTPLFGLDRGPRPLLAAGVVFLAFGLAWAIHRLFDPRQGIAIARPQRRNLADA